VAAIERSAAGSLTVVGTGITFVAHLTVEAQAEIDSADTVLYAVADPATAVWLRTRNASAEPLRPYDSGELRMHTYEAWVAEILSRVRRGVRVCAVFYGHPGVFARPAHEALRRARAEGFPARMLPGIGADACLFADLGIDPAQDGCQSFDATDFFVRKRQIDITSGLLLWQIGMTGELGAPPDAANVGALRLLTDALLEYYQDSHDVVLYEAARYSISPPSVQRLRLASLPDARITTCSTLYIPPSATANPDPERIAQLRSCALTDGREVR
jgi:uncharacterized protein YabN with tetrapyrrole methylase and pyrophosphatase domain